MSLLLNHSTGSSYLRVSSKLSFPTHSNLTIAILSGLTLSREIITICEYSNTSYIIYFK